MRHRRAVSRLAVFALAPALGIVSPLLLIPVVTSAYGGAGWVALAVGQSIGAAAAVITELGWSLNGPALVARSSQAARTRLFHLAMRTRAEVAIASVPLSAVTAYLLSPNYKIVAGAVAASITVGGLGATWYFIGAGAKWKFLISDPIPRASANVLAAFVIHLGTPLISYPILLFAGTLAGIVISIRGISGSGGNHALSPRLLRVARRQQWIPLRGRIASTLYITLPTSIVSGVRPDAVLVYSAADRLVRMLLQIVQSAPSAMQSWVGAPGPREKTTRRIEKALAANLALALTAAFLFVVVAPVAADLVFSGEVKWSWILTVSAALIIFMTICSRATGSLGLATLGRVTSITRSATAGALVGLPLTALFAWRWGAEGALFGVLAAETLVLALQIKNLAPMLLRRH